MSPNDIDICSKALLKIGASTISSFGDGTSEAEVAAALYPLVRDAVLAAHPWNFAIYQLDLPLLQTPPIADFRHAFQLPSDCIRVLSAGTSGKGSGASYRIYQRQLHTDNSNITLTYIQRVRESNFPAYFTSALVARLAAEFCIPLTENTSKWENLNKIFEIELRRAKLVDAQEDTPKRLDHFSLIESRQ